MKKHDLSDSVTFVVPVNNDDIYKNNFLSSPLFRSGHSHQILIQRNYSSAAKAYNDAIDNSLNDLIVFTHQDVLFPESWLVDLNHALDYLAENDPLWGVLGCFGVTPDGHEHGYVYCTGCTRFLGSPAPEPRLIQTLDEIVLIVKKSSGLRFDDTLPGYHFYGTDICMAAVRDGRRNYAITAFVLHNTNQVVLFPRDFVLAYRHVKKHWKSFLPIQTSCTRIEWHNASLYIRYFKRLVRTCLGVLGCTGKPRIRLKNPLDFLDRLFSKSKVS